MKRMYPDQPIVGIGVAVVNKGKLLLAKRGNEPGKGKWTIPGGLVDLGENILHAVIREAKEETCLTVADPQLLDVVDTVSYDAEGKILYHYVIVDYFVKVKGGDLKADSDVVELHWVPLDEVENYVLTSSFREFFVKNKMKLEKMDSYS